MSVHVGFVMDEVALEQVFPRVFRFSPVDIIPPVLHYTEKRKKKLIIFITGLHSKPQGCGASVASAAGPFATIKKHSVDAFFFSPMHYMPVCPWGSRNNCEVVFCNMQCSSSTVILTFLVLFGRN
jgi:hypothetical protein